jgi:hypothetical protein
LGPASNITSDASSVNCTCDAIEVWISGDGKTPPTASADESKEVKVTLRHLAGGFIASEHA